MLSNNRRLDTYTYTHLLSTHTRVSYGKKNCWLVFCFKMAINTGSWLFCENGCDFVLQFNFVLPFLFTFWNVYSLHSGVTGSDCMSYIYTRIVDGTRHKQSEAFYMCCCCWMSEFSIYSIIYLRCILNPNGVAPLICPVVLRWKCTFCHLLSRLCHTRVSSDWCVCACPSLQQIINYEFVRCANSIQCFFVVVLISFSFYLLYSDVVVDAVCVFFHQFHE